MKRTLENQYPYGDTTFLDNLIANTLSKEGNIYSPVDVRENYKFLGFAIAQQIAEKSKSINVVVPKVSTAKFKNGIRRITATGADFIKSGSGEKSDIEYYMKAVYGKYFLLVDVNSDDSIRITSAHKKYNVMEFNDVLLATNCQDPAAAFHFNSKIEITDIPENVESALDENAEEVPEDFRFWVSTELPNILKQLGISFNSQLEIIIKEEIVYLVQFRPQPDIIQRYQDSIIEIPTISNKAKYSCESIVMTGGCNRKNLPYEIIDILNNAYVKINGKTITLDEVNWSNLSKRVVILTGDMDQIPNFLKQFYKQVDERESTGVILSPRIIGPNTVHAGRSNPKNTNIPIPTFRLQQKDLDNLLKSLSQSDRISVVSNGLKALIYTSQTRST